MLSEIRPIKQHEGDFFRRWFEDEFFDLFLWYNAHQEIVGFQLCYEKSNDERALTWIDASGYAHHRVDTGEQSVWETKSPVLTASGAFPRQRVLDNFRERSKSLEPEVVQYVVQKIEQYE